MVFFSSGEGLNGDEIRRIFFVKYQDGQLLVEKLVTHSNSFSNGDPSPMLDVEYNFLAHKISARFMRDQRDEKIFRASEKLPASCSAPALETYQTSNHPDCTGAARKKISAELHKKSGEIGDDSDDIKSALCGRAVAGSKGCL
jgi:hypothetical protein